MQTPLQITCRGIALSGGLEARLHEKAGKLGAVHPEIVSCRIVIEEIQRHQRNGREFTMRIDARVPGHDIVVSRSHDEDIYVALRDAFNAFERQLEDYARAQRAEMKSPSQAGRIAGN